MENKKLYERDIWLQKNHHKVLKMFLNNNRIASEKIFSPCNTKFENMEQ